MSEYKNTFNSIDEYISQFPEDLRRILQEIRNTIKNAAPDAKEKISYQMPTFYLYGKNLVHFAAYKNHIGFYPTPSGIEEYVDIKGKTEEELFKGFKDKDIELFYKYLLLLNKNSNDLLVGIY